LRICGACSRHNLECVLVPSHQLVAHPRSQTTGVITQVPKTPFANLLPNWQAAQQRDQNEILFRRHAMKYYIDVLSQLLTVSIAHNTFVSAILPMAVVSQTLANALIAYASDHMCAIDSCYATVSINARSRALSGLARDFASGSGVEVSVAVSMILLTSEVCNGNYDAWYYHLLGAKHFS
jgi:hypothetical protein